MPGPVRFWGTVVAVKPRLVVARFGGDSSARCHGHILVLDGTHGPEHGGKSEQFAGRFSVALGPATQQQRELGAGDLLRGDAHPVPGNAPDTPADLYRVGALRVVARQGNPGTPPRPADDPPRTDPPLTPEAAEAAGRRSLAPDNLFAEDGVCVPCPYGAVAAVVQLSDPRDWKNRRWRQVPACLGPDDCPHYAAPPPPRPGP